MKHDKILEEERQKLEDRERMVRVGMDPNRTSSIVQAIKDNFLGTDSKSHRHDVSQAFANMGQGAISAFDNHEFTIFMAKHYLQVMGEILGHGLNTLRERITPVNVDTNILPKGMLDSTRKQAINLDIKNVALKNPAAVGKILSIGMKAIMPENTPSPTMANPAPAQNGSVKHPTFYPQPGPAGPSR